MTDREKTIEALVHCSMNKCDGCPMWHYATDTEDGFGCTKGRSGLVIVSLSLINDAISELKKEP